MIEEYEHEELVEDSDDEKRIHRAQSQNNQASKRSRIQTNMKLMFLHCSAFFAYSRTCLALKSYASYKLLLMLSVRVIGVCETCC